MSLGHEAPASFGPQQRQFNPYSGSCGLIRSQAQDIGTGKADLPDNTQTMLALWLPFPLRSLRSLLPTPDRAKASTFKPDTSRVYTSSQTGLVFTPTLQA